MKCKVRYTVDFVTEIEIDSIEDLNDACSDIDIPETSSNQYVQDTFEVLSVVDEQGKLVSGEPDFFDDQFFFDEDEDEDEDEDDD